MQEAQQNFLCARLPPGSKRETLFKGTRWNLENKGTGLPMPSASFYMLRVRHNCTQVSAPPHTHPTTFFKIKMHIEKEEGKKLMQTQEPFALPCDCSEISVTGKKMEN